jgi:hypothetical protein
MLSSPVSTGMILQNTNNKNTMPLQQQQAINIELALPRKYYNVKSGA